MTSGSKCARQSRISRRIEDGKSRRGKSWQGEGHMWVEDKNKQEAEGKRVKEHMSIQGNALGRRRNKKKVEPMDGFSEEIMWFPSLVNTK